MDKIDFKQADSKEEVYFSWWLNELMRAGYIIDWTYQPNTFLLSEKIMYMVHVQLKTKIRVDPKVLMHKHTYTPDFWIAWSLKSQGLFYNNLCDKVDLKSCAVIAQLGESYIDVKPKAWGNNSFMEVFKNNQKWTYKRHGVFVQPLVVYGGKTSVFESTFCPERFRLTDATMRKRKINFHAAGLKEFLLLGNLK